MFLSQMFIVVTHLISEAKQDRAWLVLGWENDYLEEGLGRIGVEFVLMFTQLKSIVTYFLSF